MTPARFGAALVTTALLMTPLSLIDAPAARAAPPKGTCRTAEPAHPVERMLPWAQQLLEPERAWPFSTGAGVTVGVVDSGVDRDHPQLRRRGKVLTGRDFYHQGKLPGSYDCVSHGTGIAGIIAADRHAGLGFSGVAPGARILPVKVSEREADNTGRTEVIPPSILANGIRYAVDHGARVLNLSIAGSRDDKPVRDAIAYAVRRDVVVVAAAGNQQANSAGPLRSYPADYPGVIGVGAIDVNGARMDASQIGRYVDLVAPGDSVLTSTRIAGHAYQSGTSFAAGYVSGTAALVRSAWPTMPAAEVIKRLLATATPARGGANSQEYGAGIVDPYRAVTEAMPKGAAQPMPGAVVPPVDPLQVAHSAWWQGQSSTARDLTLLATAVALIVLLVSVLLTVGRRRGWVVRRSAIERGVPRQAELPPEFLFARRDSDT
ncbi:type VII secretion-associated serine protease mycosin [Kribbella sandramycini]|nr:type VII secretion-associated serine protease mycosin [Kribbella sandramycini]